MKFKIVTLILLLVLLSSCIVNIDNDECSNDDDCKNLGENYICRMGVNEDYLCTKDLCKDIDCGAGVCNMRPTPFCDCYKDAYSKYNYEERKNECYYDYKCENANDCYRVNMNFNYLYVCNTEGTCVETCKDSSDCIGKKEVCVYGRKCFDYDKEYNYSDEYDNFDRCKNGFYNDKYDNLRCKPYCDSQNLCKQGFKCIDMECTPLCLTDEDCKKDKFTSDICDLELNVCN